MTKKTKKSRYVSVAVRRTPEWKAANRARWEKRDRRAAAKGKSLAGHSANLADIHAEVLPDHERDALDWTNDASRKLPEPGEVMDPFGWKVLVMPMRRETVSRGGILIPQVVQDTDMYLNYIGRIVALGPLAFKHAKYADMGLRPEDQYKRGDWVVYPIYQYARIDFKGTKLILLNDDSFLGRVPEGVSPWDFKVER